MRTLQQMLMLLGVAARAIAAQDPTPGADLPTDGNGPLSTRAHGLTALPVVMSTPALGAGLGAVAVYQFQLDSSNGSSIGLGGVYTTTNSWMFSVGSRVWFHASRRQGVGGIAGFEANYDFFGIGFDAGRSGHSVPISQRGDAEVLEFLGELPNGIYIGPRFLHHGLTTSLRGTDHRTDPLAAVVNIDADYNIAALGGVLRYDSRDNDDAPHRGNKSDIKMMWASGWTGSDSSYAFFDGAVNQYLAVDPTRVLALRLSACSVGANAPIWEYCLYGTNSDLRGYEGGRYRDRSMFAGQAEFRTPIVGRLGAAVFGGVGEVAQTFSAISWDHLLPSAGFGLRWLESRRRHTTIGVDYAWGRGTSAFYLRIGEAY